MFLNNKKLGPRFLLFKNFPLKMNNTKNLWPGLLQNVCETIRRIFQSNWNFLKKMRKNIWNNYVKAAYLWGCDFGTPCSTWREKPFLCYLILVENCVLFNNTFFKWEKNGILIARFLKKTKTHTKTHIWIFPNLRKIRKFLIL